MGVQAMRGHSEGGLSAQGLKRLERRSSGGMLLSSWAAVRCGALWRVGD